MGSSKKAKSLLNSKKIFALLFLSVFVGVASYLKVDITPLALKLLPQVFSKTYQNISFDKAELRGDLSVSLENFTYQPDPPFTLKTQHLDLKFSIIQFLFGQLNFSKISAQKLEATIPKESPWLTKMGWKKKKSEILKRKEWLSLLNSEFDFDTLSLFLDDKTYTFSNFKFDSNLSEDQIDIDLDWKFMYSNFTPNLYEGSAELTLDSSNWKSNLTCNSPLGFIEIKAHSAKSFENISAELFLDSDFEKVSAWLFKPETHMKGSIKSKLLFSTYLTSPLQSLKALGDFNSEFIEIEGLAFQNKSIIQTMAPEFKKIKMEKLFFETQIDAKHIVFKNMSAEGDQFKINGDLTSDWEANFFTQLQVTLSKSSTEKLSPLAQKSFSKNEKGQAYFPLEITGTPKDHSLTNMGQLLTGAVGNHIKTIGTKLLDIF